LGRLADQSSKGLSRYRRTIETDLTAQLVEWRQFFGRQIPIARQALSRLLAGTRIVWTPDPVNQRYHYGGQAVFDQIVSGAIDVTQRVTSPPGSVEGCTVKFSGMAA
jgi:hypothetical protein